MEKRKKILFLAGPLHLFWTTGVFYLMELREDFDIHLVVPDEYESSARFVRFKASFDVNVLYLKNKRGIKRHTYYSALFHGLLSTLKPDIVLLHNRFYLDALYLLYWSKRVAKQCLRVSYQDGRMSLSWDADFEARAACDANLLMNKYPFITSWMKSYWVFIQYWIAYGLNTLVWPWVVIRRRFYPCVDVWSGRVIKRYQSRNFEDGKDWMLAYDSIEISEWWRLCGRSPLQVVHPLRTVPHEVVASVLATDVEPVGVVVLPTYGLLTSLIKDGVESERAVVDGVAGQWIRSIKILAEKFPHKKIGIKLHPGAQLDVKWAGILVKIKSEIPEIIVFDSRVTAEELMLRSDVVVGDVSTCLYWASLLPSTLVISLDVFGYRGGDEMKAYPAIRYIQNLEELESLSGQTASVSGSDAATMSVRLCILSLFGK